jgi:hypothetical protein
VRITSFVLGSAALLSVAGMSVPALAYTHHPSTASERKQTNDLNSQQLAQAQGQPMQQQAANTAMPNTAMPDQQNNAQPNNAMTTTSPTATAPADQQNQQDATKPAQPSDQAAQPQPQTQQPSPQQ